MNPHPSGLKTLLGALVFMALCFVVAWLVQVNA